MTSNLILFACGLAVIVCGLVSGVFLAFSDFIMKSLAAASPDSGIESMQLINRKVYGSVFLILLMGMAALSLVLSGYAYQRMSGSASGWIVVGGAIYFIGVFLVTIVFNVPMNKRLDMMDLAAAETATYWSTYVPTWTFWNHIRTFSAAVSSACFLIACLSL